ncbi:MAG: tetratricopeptide repeat protein [Acidobacteriota bacterium]
MSLAAGTRLGSFEVLGPLGAGGMGEVYRASDLRLGREVAIKILPEIFAEDPDRLARFEREARLLASVNHPGLAAIYGIEQAGSLRYIVMELVPGETLAEQLARGPLAIQEALRLARQIAEALEAAHEKGIVHRDLKPANIKVTPDGKVKVLDLGLAKAMDPKIETGDTSQSPTMMLDQTRPGVILGTAEFMSPEQARGKAVDKRTDIWAFGCILYEMLSGWRIFRGETISDVLAAILTSEPEWNRLPRQTPPRVRDLLQRCLKKDANERLRDIGDARLELAGESANSGVGALAAETPRPRRAWLIVGTIAVVLAAGGVWSALRTRAAPAAAALSEGSLVVLPAHVISDSPGGQAFGDGIVETLSVRLNEVPGIQVVTPRAAVAASDTSSDPFGAARSVGANLVVKSSVQRSGGRLRIVYSVWNVRTRYQVAGGTVDGSPSEFFGMQDQVAAQVAKGLKLPMRTRRTPAPSGLDTAEQQQRYTEALGHLQRYDRPKSVEAAVSILRDLASKAPSSPLVFAALGRADLASYILTHDAAWAQRARDDCQRARQLDANLPEVHVTLGQLLTRTGRPADAVAEFQSALALQPDSVEALLGLGNALERGGRAAEAEAAVRRAIALQPAYWASYNQLGTYQYNAGRFAEAAAQYERVVALTPDNVRGWNNLGGAWYQAGNFDKARDAFQKSLAVKPNDGASSNLGTLEFFLGHYREAAQAFEEATKLTPANHLYWNNLGDARRWTPELRGSAADAYSRALSLANQTLDVNSKDVSAHLTAANTLAKTGRIQQAREHMKQALLLGPDDPDSLMEAGVVAQLDGKTKEALQWIEKARSKGLGAAQVEHEPEFQTLRDLPAFRNAVKGRG